MDISVVIPLYNKEAYIYRTLASILKQTAQPSEIIIVNDGSTDNSISEVARFADERIRLIHQENAGEGATRNRGVAEASNELVAFLDADDEWKPDFLLHIQRLYNNFPDCGAYATAYEIVGPDGTKSFPVLKGISPAPWIGIIPNLFWMMQYGMPFFPSSVAIPRTVIDEVGGFPVGVTQGADRMMWVRLGLEYPIAFSPSRQSVWHGDVINRASVHYEPEPATANLIDEMLRNHKVPLALQQDVKDFNACLKIQKSIHRIKAGQSQSARVLLNTIKQNRKYRKQWLWWYFWSFIPFSIVKHLGAKS